MISVESGQEVWRLAEEFEERNAELSPDGRWMAYQSDESGRWEIYVRPFPGVEEDQVQVSNNHGLWPLWSPDGSELFYLEPPPTAGPASLISVSTAVGLGDTRFSFGVRQNLMDWPYFVGGEGRNYDVSPDGQRFLGNKAIGEEGANAPPLALTVVQNWFEDVRRRTGGR
jgi:serine/threonine-protein kinase